MTKKRKKWSIHIKRYLLFLVDRFDARLLSILANTKKILSAFERRPSFILFCLISHMRGKALFVIAAILISNNKWEIMWLIERYMTIIIGIASLARGNLPPSFLHLTIAVTIETSYMRAKIRSQICHWDSNGHRVCIWSHQSCLTGTLSSVLITHQVDIIKLLTL